MFMTLKIAAEIIEEDDQQQQAHHECMAEAGMGAVSLGLSGYDGMSEYSVITAEHEAEWAESSDGIQYFRRLYTAQQVAADFDALVVYNKGEFGSAFFGATVVPEYYPHADPNAIPF
jgi:hypothetical protein